MTSHEYPLRGASYDEHQGKKARNASPLVRADGYWGSGSSSHSLVHKTGIPIAAVDISPGRTHAILAGRDILKTIRVAATSCSEDFNLRSAIIAYASTHDSARGALSAQHKDQLAATDVKWSHGKFDTTIATAAANGRIVLYDINRAGVELARLHEHTRQVHKVAFNPHQGALLLSGSQDATIRMWDLRILAGERSVMTCRSINTYTGNNEGIRDLKCSPSDGVEFAAGTDNGVVQRWDFRNDKKPLLKVNAHDKTCHSIDYHPSGKYLASGGADKNVKVWDIKSADRRMKPSWQLRAPQAVLNIRWRLVGSSPATEETSGRQCTYLATSYDQKDPRIHVWDLRRPHVPAWELDRYETPATDLLWCSEDLLWSVGHTGMFTQSDMNHAVKPIERLNVNVLATSPNGQICYFSKARARKPKPLLDPSNHYLQRSNTGESSGEKLGSSHSATDGSLEEASILSSTLRKRRQKSLSTRTTGSTTGSIPPATSGNSPASSLDEAMKPEGRFRPDQVFAYGRVLGTFDVAAFKYLATHYRQPKLLSKRHDMYQFMPALFEENAIFAAHAGQYRLAQSWRVLGTAAQNELRGRAEIVSQHRLNRPNKRITIPRKTVLPRSENTHSAHHLSPSASNRDSTSNMPTPLAKPAQQHPASSTDIDDEMSLDAEAPAHLLGPAWKPKPILEGWETRSQRSRSSSCGESTSEPLVDDSNHEILVKGSADHDIPTEFGTFTDIDQIIYDRRAALNNYKAKPRSPLRLDDALDLARRVSVFPYLDRHDSDESFQMLSASADSNPRSMSVVGSFGESYRSSPSDNPEGRWDTSFRQTASKSVVSPDADVNIGVNMELVVKTDLPMRLIEPNKEENASDMQHQILPGDLVLRRPSSLIHPKVYIRGSQESDDRSAGHLSQPAAGCTPTEFKALLSPPQHSAPWSLTALLSPIIDFHLINLSDLQFPAYLSLYLRPLFPYLFDPNAVTATLLSYHQQLISLGLFVEAATMRNQCYPDYPDIWELGIGDNRGAGWYCTTCNKVVKGDAVGYCARCRQDWGLCPICESSDSPLPSTETMRENDGFQALHGTNLWAWCQECGHGGHDSCLRIWWADAIRSEGGCPCQGCLHDCIPGIRRNERFKERELGRTRAKLKAGGVEKDQWDVGESKAVERTRGLVALKGKVPGDGSSTRTPSKKGGRLSVGLGLGGKKVRLVEPGAGAGTGENMEDELETGGSGEGEKTSRSVP